MSKSRQTKEKKEIKLDSYTSFDQENSSTSYSKRSDTESDSTSETENSGSSENLKLKKINLVEKDDLDENSNEEYEGSDPELIKNKDKGMYMEKDSLEELKKQRKELAKISIKGNIKQAVKRANQFCLKNSVHSKKDDSTLKRASIFTKMLDFKRMGLGVYLYFSFYRELILLYFFLACCGAAYIYLYWNDNSDHYNDRNKWISFLNKSSFGQTQVGTFEYSVVIEVVLVILLNLWKTISELYLFLRKKAAYSHPDNLSPAHFTIFLTNLPNEISKKRIRKAFSKFGKIKYITFIDSNLKLIGASNMLNKYYIKRTEIMLKKFTQKLKKKRLIDKKLFDQKQLPRKVKKLNKKIDEYYEKVKAYNQDTKPRKPIVFVTFNSVACALNSIRAYEKLRGFKVKKRVGVSWIIQNRSGKPIKVERASSPEDYIFQNIRYTKWQRLMRSLFLNIVSLPLIFTTAGFIYLIKNDPSGLFEKSAFVMDYLISTVIFLISWLSKKILKKTSTFRKSETITQYEGSQMGFIVAFQALNIVIPLILNYWSSEDFFGETSTIIFLNALYSGFVSPTIFILFRFYKKHWKRYRGRKKYSQYLLNQAYAPRTFELRNFYFTVLRNLSFNLMFVSFYPSVILPCLLSLLYIYILHKLLILRYYAKPIGYSEIIHQTVLKQIQFLFYTHFACYLLIVVTKIDNFFGQEWYVLFVISAAVLLAIFIAFKFVTKVIKVVFQSCCPGIKKISDKKLMEFREASRFSQLYNRNFYKIVDWKELFGVKSFKKLKKKLKLENFNKENFKQNSSNYED
ncbi:putative transmembrane protein [Anaeramoeba flamelloides]|uniref:Transmembrane protein n=1 Tax=Anaeramoeba flamelloides TaxID=1746091 RepID=A0ABQ8Z220_9EUKA|nr:putative transmembrane protein [Anaeramoeba flamelloides]